MASPTTVFVNQLLTDVSVSYKNDSYIADQLFPTVFVDKITGLYFVSDKENLRAPASALRAEIGRANRVTNTLTTANYSLKEKSLETPISDIVMRNYSNPFDPKRTATQLVTEKLMLDKELDLQTTLLATTRPTLNAANSWSTVGTDIVGQIRTARTSVQKNTGKKANTVVIGKPAWDVLMKNTALLASIQYVSQVTEANIRNAIAAWFDVDRVLVGDAIANTAKEGQTDTMGYLWGNNIIVAYVAPSAQLETPSAGYTLTLKDARYIDEWYEQERKTTFIRANDFYQSKIVDPYAMYVITNAV